MASSDASGPSRVLLAVQGHVAGEKMPPSSRARLFALGVPLFVAGFALGAWYVLGTSPTSCLPFFAAWLPVAIATLAPRRLQGTVEVTGHGLVIRTPLWVRHVEWSEVGGLSIEATGAGAATLGLGIGRDTLVIQNVSVAEAYQLRHAMAWVGGVREPDDIGVERAIEWNQAWFRVWYPVPGIAERRIIVDEEHLKVMHRQRMVSQLAWSDVRSLGRAATGEVTWTTDEGRGFLLLLPPAIADAVYEAMGQQWRRYLDRQAPPQDEGELRRLQSLKGRATAERD